MAGTRPKNTYQTISLVILTTKGNLGQRNQGRVGKNKTPESHIVTTTFILQYHLQHLIIGFGMSSKSSFPYNTLSSPPIINASSRTSSHTKMATTTKAPPSPLVIDFDIYSHNSDFDTLRNKANVKGTLRKKLEHWHHIGANPSVIDTMENGYKMPFFTTPVSNFFQNNLLFRTQTL